MAAEGGPGMPAVDPSGRTPVRSGDVEGVGNFDTTLFFFFFLRGEGWYAVESISAADHVCVGC